MKTVILLLAAFSMTSSYAQTNRIAHYSHSGSAMTINLFEKLETLGCGRALREFEPPATIEYNQPNLDSLIKAKELIKELPKGAACEPKVPIEKLRYNNSFRSPKASDSSDLYHLKKSPSTKQEHIIIDPDIILKEKEPIQSSQQNGRTSLKKSSISIKAIPNPFSNEIRITIKTPTTKVHGTLSLTNSLGQLVYRGHINTTSDREIVIDQLKTLHLGAYVLVFEDKSSLDIQSIRMIKA